MTDALSPLDVTVVIPTFNRAKLIVRSLDSVRHQTRRPAAIIVVDDGSRDGTPEIATDWGKEHRMPVLVHRMSRNGGPAAARNKGIELAQTRHVAFLDSDDEHLPHALETLCGAFAAHPDAVMSFGDAIVQSETTREPHGIFTQHLGARAKTHELDDGRLELSQPTDALLDASIIPTSATCFSREVAMAVGGMPAEFRCGEDWLFFLRLAGRGRFIFNPQDVAIHHRHDANLTSAQAAEFVCREKLRGLAALGEGEAGIELNTTQRQHIGRIVEQQQRTWHYHLSRMGMKPYLGGLRSPVGRQAGGLLDQFVREPKNLLRALAASLGVLR